MCEKAYPLNNPDKHTVLSNHLTAVFTTEEAYEVAAITQLSKHIFTRLLKGLNTLIISKIKHVFHEKLQKKGDIVTFWRFDVFKSSKNPPDASPNVTRETLNK